MGGRGAYSQLNERVLAARGDGGVYNITDAVIERVPLLRIEGYSEDECAQIQQKHKDLLKYAKDENDNNEVAFVLNSDLGDPVPYKGTDDSLSFSNTLRGSNLIVMHNHPRNNTFSDTDLIFLLSNDNVRTLTVVKNNGAVESITKTAAFDRTKAVTKMQRVWKKVVTVEDDAHIDAFVKKFLSNPGGGLLWQKSF